MAEKKKPICAIVGAGDYIGAAIAKRFAAEGFAIVAGRRSADKFAPLQKDIEAAGGVFYGESLDARSEESQKAFFEKVGAVGELHLCIFNVGGNVYFPFQETTARVYRKVWEMCALAGFLTAQAALPHLLARKAGSLFFTGATASVVSNVGYSAFASGKFALRALSGSLAREFGPQNIHIAHLLIDAGVNTAWVRARITEAGGAEALDKLHPDQLMNPASIANTYWHLHQQPRDCWTYELDVRPFLEPLMRR